jgi:glycosyltransferase involved in cell wall biosynthesis
MSTRRITLVGLVAGGHGGVPRYTQSLVRALDGVAGEFADLELTVLTTERGVEALGPLSLPVRTVPLRAPRLNRGLVRVAADQIAALKADAQLLHFFDLTGPLLAPRRPFVATAHDLSFLHGYGRILQLHKRKLIPFAVRRARALVAISNFTRNELIDRLDAPADKITVIHSGPGLTGVTAAGPAAPAPQQPYLLYVGNLTESKNLPFLIRAFDRADLDLDLVLAGRPLERYRDIVQEVERATRRERIRFVFDASDADVDVLYRHATALLLPSRYEGFGLTALEGMARGTPVLASDIPAIREISGAGAELLPPDDEQAWSGSLERVAKDAAYRQELAERGHRAAAGYSWSRTARDLCELLRRVEIGRR